MYVNLPVSEWFSLTGDGASRLCLIFVVFGNTTCLILNVEKYNFTHICFGEYLKSSFLVFLVLKSHIFDCSQYSTVLTMDPNEVSYPEDIGHGLKVLA